MKRLSILLLCTLLYGCISLPSSPKIGPYEEVTMHEGGENKVLVIDISGIIVDSKEKNVFGSETEMNMTARIREQFDKAREDEKIDGIILRINSPGGDVTTSDIINHEIRKYKEDTGNYVIAQLNNIAASGGYYIAVAADEIIAHPTTITGSIGVIITMINIHGLMEKLGIEDQTIASGKSKEMGSIMKKMTPEEQRLFKNIVDSLYERFVQVVLKGREDLTREKLLSVADGRILLGPEAKEAGLIDHVGYWNDTVEIIKKSTKLEDPTIVAYTRPGQYKPNIYSGTRIENRGTINILSLDTDMFYSKYGISFMYLWKP